MPTMPIMRTTTPAGERLLDAASELFYTRGIHAVGVELISEVAGTTKKTLYDRFGSKDTLVALYLERRLERWKAYVEERLARHRPGVEKVLAVFDALEEWLGQHSCGCAFVNAHAEIGQSDHPGVAVIRAEKSWTRACYQRLVAEALPELGTATETTETTSTTETTDQDASRNDDADRALDADTLGAQLHLLHEGAIVDHTVGARPEAISDARAAARRLLGVSSA
ncbi:MAG TPA: TetR/AcrR family transcriptional regulator [Actinopolymorphaceae bacterium]